MNKLVIKFTGELFSYRGHSPSLDNDYLANIIEQLRTLQAQRHVGLVFGGGNFFRGAVNNNHLKLEPSSAHTIGMLSTMVNGIVFRNMLSQADIDSVILSAFFCPDISQPISDHTIKEAFEQNKIIIFVGGTGNPFFTTDTNAVLRALQIGASEVWKATKVDGIFASDPHEAPQEKTPEFYKTISYKDIIEKNLSVIDHMSVTLAQEHNLPIRVFNIFTQDSLKTALENPEFGSTIR